MRADGDSGSALEREGGATVAPDGKVTAESEGGATEPLLVLDGVDVAIGDAPILHGIDLAVRAGETLGIVGESGSGKSMTALAAMRLLPRGARLAGRIGFAGRDLARLGERAMQRVRGGEIGMVFQEPMTALNPLATIGDQVAECIRLHGVAERAPNDAARAAATGGPRGERNAVRRVSRVEAAFLARETLARVGLPPERFPPSRYPHELSGGQRQRVVIAIAIACRPRLLIADEPTTALDVTTQAGVLELLRELRREEELALILISHDLAVVADMADEIAVMKDGRVVDAGAFGTVFSRGASPYAASLARASGWAPAPGTRSMAGGELLAVENLVVSYATGPRRLFGERERFRAVDGVSFSIARGESVGLVGESGCGKSTLARALLGLAPIDAGTVRFDGSVMFDDAGEGGPSAVGDAADEALGRAPLDRPGGASRTANGSDATRDGESESAASSGPRPRREATVPRALRREIQVVFQDPYGSFNPRHRVERLVAEPLHLLDERLSRRARRERVVAMLERVGIGADAMRRYIHEFSGGQRQRIAIARALVVEPSLVVLDEAVSALDVSVRAQVLALLAELAADAGLAYLFVSHDLSVVRNVTDRVLVMRGGRLVESGETERVFAAPEHPYTRELVAAVPRLPTSVADAFAAREAGEAPNDDDPAPRSPSRE